MALHKGLNARQGVDAVSRANFSRRAVVAALMGIAGMGAAVAQKAEFQPTRGMAGKDVIWIATPDTAVTRMLQMAQIQPTDKLVDLGSGDGKIPIAAALNYGIRARGLEYNPKLVAFSIEAAKKAGVADKLSLEEADIFVTDFSEASVVTMYLLPHLNQKLRPKLLEMKPGTRLLSNSFDMANWQPDEISHVGTTELMLWYVPANASGTWVVPALGEKAHFKIHQQFQKVVGELVSGSLRSHFVEPQLHADSLRFLVRDAEGRMTEIVAKVDGERLRGTLRRQGQEAQAFEATRTGGRQELITPLPVRQSMRID